MKTHKMITLLAALLLITSGCRQGDTEKSTSGIKNPECTVEKSFFGFSPEGDSVFLFTITNELDYLVKIMNYGGIITEIHTPDREGRMDNIVLGFDRLEPYLEGHPYFGAIVGRYGNRIANAQFTIDGETYLLEANNGPNALHGGIQGFDKKVWDPEVISCDERAVLRLSYLSPDGEEGTPAIFRSHSTTNC